MDHAAVTTGHIAFERRGALGLIRLTRPDALNALTHGMVLAMSAQLDAWAADDRVATVAVQGEGRAFSAGGDIRAIYERGMAGEPFDAFFADEYALNIKIKRYPKPYVALVNSIAMGGGVGVAYQASHVVVGERARFAMPECSIGFFPDVGGTALLSALPGEWGPYLGLTGARMGAREQVALGLATDAVPADRHAELLNLLSQGEESDTALARLSRFAIAADGPVPGTVHWSDEPEATSLGYKDYAKVIELERSRAVEPVEIPEGWGPSAGQSPTSTRVATRQIALGDGLTFEQAMGIEARITHRMLRGHDFYEGIRAAIIDKGATPAWSPATLGKVTDEAVAAYFAPVEDGPLAPLSALADGVVAP